jgi:hypothetical protein
MRKIGIFNGEEPTSLATIPLKVKQKLDIIIIDIETRIGHVKKDFFEIGRLLSKAKEMLPHGLFQEWIDTHFTNELPYSTAAAYMKIFETFKENPKMVQHLPVTLLMKMTHKDFPEEIVKIINERLPDDQVDAKSVNEAYELYRRNEIDLDHFEKIAQKQIDLAIHIAKGSTERRIGEHMKNSTSAGVSALISFIDRIYKPMLQISHLTYPDQRESMVGNIDSAIQRLNEIKSAINNLGGFYEEKEDEKTGELKLKYKETA